MDSLNHCPCSPEVAEAYAMERLAADKVEAFENHLLICPDCQDRVADADAFIWSIRAALSAETHANRPRARSRKSRIIGGQSPCEAFGQS